MRFVRENKPYKRREKMFSKDCGVDYSTADIVKVEIEDFLYYFEVKII